MPNWKESQDYYFWPCSPQEGTFSALMGFCYCWLPSVWRWASRVENCLESCMKYNTAQAICCSTFQHDVYFEKEKKKKRGKKLLSLAVKKKIPLTWLAEHTLLTAVVLSQCAARTGTLHREVINLILLVMISRTCRSGSQAQAATLCQENKGRDDTRSSPKEEVKSHVRQENVHPCVPLLGFPICKMESASLPHEEVRRTCAPWMWPLWVLEVTWARLSPSPAPGAQLLHPSHHLPLPGSGRALLLLLLLAGRLFFPSCVTLLTITSCKHLPCVSGCCSLTSSMTVGMGAELSLSPEFLTGFFLLHIVLFCSLSAVLK